LPKLVLPFAEAQQNVLEAEEWTCASMPKQLVHALALAILNFYK
jgi:hypothetical protein